MSERNKQALVAFFTGLVLVEIPVLIDYWTAIPTPSANILLAGLAGGVLTAIKRWSETAPSSVSQLHAETYETQAVPTVMREGADHAGV